MKKQRVVVEKLIFPTYKKRVVWVIKDNKLKRPLAYCLNEIDAHLITGLLQSELEKDYGISIQ